MAALGGRGCTGLGWGSCGTRGVLMERQRNGVQHPAAGFVSRVDLGPGMSLHLGINYHSGMDFHPGVHLHPVVG